MMGDFFWEIVIDMDDPKQGILNLVPLPPDSMYRIETTKGKLVEFQQSNEGPDYQSLSRVEVAQATDADLQTATAIRFAPDQIIHLRIGDDRKTFYPYGVSLIEAARGPAHQLRLMEDSMIVYRLCLIGETRVRTSNGWKYIKDVRRGDAVHVFNRELMCSQMALINNQFLTGTKRVYRVKSKHVSLTGTDTHPVLVKRVNGSIEYVAISDLVPKQDMFINVHELSEVETRFPCMSDEIWAKLSPTQLFQFKNNNYENRSMLMRECEFLTKIPANRIKQFLYTSGKSLEYNAAYVICDKFKLDYNDLIKGKKGEIRPERIKLPEFVDENFAKLFGFMIGDGSVGDYKLCFASSPDQFLNSQYASLLKKYFGKVTFCPEKRSRKTPGLGAYSVSSKSACDIFIKMGYVRGAKNKRIPHWVFTSPLSIRQAFIQGLADADACIKNLPTGLWTAEFEMCNKSLIEDIKELWNSTGFSSGHIRHRKRKGGHEIEPGRKMKATEAWSVYISKKPLNAYEAIQSIECVGEEDVYDIEVDHPEHNFIANGVPVHNSRAPERRVFYIDTFSLPPYKAEAFMERMKDQFKKKKVGSGKSGLMGASAVEERWHAPAADEDFWIPVRPNSNTRVETLPGACLALDTKIPLLDGRTLTLSEIIEEFNTGKQLWAYSCNNSNGSIVPGKITWAGITRKNTKVMKITFDNDESVICTLDHKFPILEKGFIEAQHLKINDSLIPFNTKLSKIRSNHKSEYVQVYDPSDKTWKFAHRMVIKFFKNTELYQENIFSDVFADENKETIHHLDLNRFNNNPENLTWMNNKDHYKLHEWLSSEYAHIGGKARAAQIADWKEKNDPQYHAFVEKNKNQLASWRKSLSKAERKAINGKISTSLKKFWEELSPEERIDWNKSLHERGMLGNESLKSLLKDPCFNSWFGDRIRSGFDNFRKTERYKVRSQKISKNNKERWSNDVYKNNIVVKQTIIYPKQIMDLTYDYTKQDLKKSEIICLIANNKELMNVWKSNNEHIKRKISFNFTIDHFNKMIQAAGYKNWKQFKQELCQYNHRIV